MPEVTFEAVEAARGRLAGSDALLERYFAVKLESLQFAGGPNFGLPIWDGLDSLVMTFPLIGWLARALHHLPAEKAVQTAVRVVDDSFGFNPLLGTPRQKSALRRLSASGELARLVAWYGR
jgi:lysine-N-methylase